MLAMSITWIGGQPLSELSILKAHERNLVEAIARGESVDPLPAKLKAEETRKKELVQKLSVLTDPTSVNDLDRTRLKKDLRARLADATALLNRNKLQTRQMLKQLIGERNR